MIARSGDNGLKKEVYARSVSPKCFAPLPQKRILSTRLKYVCIITHLWKIVREGQTIVIRDFLGIH